MFVSLVLLLFVLPCWANIVNVTIDDGNGDEQSGLKPEYTRSWYTATDHKPKNVTQLWGVDLSKAHDHTLSQAGFRNGNVTLRFIGTNIYVFFVVMDSGPDDDHLTFYLDDGPEPVSTYGANFDDWQYNHLVFQSDSLTQGNHSLIVESTSPAFFFDYAIYTTDNSTVLDDPSDPDPFGLDARDSQTTASTRSIAPTGVTRSRTTDSQATTPPSDTPAAKNHASIHYGAPATAVVLGAAIILGIST